MSDTTTLKDKYVIVLSEELVTVKVSINLWYCLI